MNVFTRFSVSCLLLLAVTGVQATTLPTEGLTLAEPTYDCATRQLTIRASGGNGSTIEYMVPGQSRWSSSPTLVLDAAIAAESSVITLLARQSNGTGAPTVSKRTFNIAAVCGGNKATPPPVATPAKSTGLLITGLNYNCGTRQLSVQTSGGNGAAIMYMVTSQSRWVDSPTFTIDESAAPVLMVLASQQSETGTPYLVKQMLDLAQRCGSEKVNPRATDTTPTGLQLNAPSYDCTTRQLTIQTSGGNGTPIEYMVVGQGRWASSSTVVIDPAVMTDSGQLVILARQKNTQGVPTVVQQSVNTVALCGGR